MIIWEELKLPKKDIDEKDVDMNGFHGRKVLSPECVLSVRAHIGMFPRKKNDYILFE